jgi:hypothetical protein
MINDLESSIFAGSIDNVIDAENLIDFNINDIGEKSESDAVSMIQNLSKFYYDDGFMEANPTFKKRVDTELESLRILIKMRKLDEIAHDNLLRAISSNSSNASLYRSLTELQKTMISITSKIQEIITGLNNLMKGYQLEINFQNDEDEKDVDEQCAATDTYRGTKEFIEKMNNIINEKEEE